MGASRIILESSDPGLLEACLYWSSRRATEKHEPGVLDFTEHSK